MKKFLSLVLSLAIVASCVAMLTFTANAATSKLTVDFESDNPFIAPVTGKVEVVDGGVSGKCLKFTGAANSWGAPFLSAEKSKSIVTAAGKYTVEFDIKLAAIPADVQSKGIVLISRKTGDAATTYATINASKTFVKDTWYHVTQVITVGEEATDANFRLGFDRFDYDGTARYIDNFEVYPGAPTYYAAGVQVGSNGYAIVDKGVFAGLDFGGKDVKEVEFAVFVEEGSGVNNIQLCQGWGSSFYNGKWDDTKWNTAVENKAWNTMNPGKTAKAVDSYIEDGNHPEALTGTQYSDKEGITMARFKINVPANASVVNFQTQYLLKGKELSEKFAHDPNANGGKGNVPEGEEDTDYAAFKYVTPASNAYTAADFGLRINGAKKETTVYIYCISDAIVNSNLANGAAFSGTVKGFTGLKDEAALKAATSEDFIKLIKEPPATPTPTTAPTAAPTTAPTTKPAATPVVKDAYVIDATKMTLDQLVKAKAGITTLPDGNNTVKYTVFNPNDFDIVVSLMMQTGTNTDVCLEGSSGYEAGKENKCAEGWRFVRNAEGKPLNEKFVTVKAGKTAELTFTFPVKDNKVVCDFCGNSHDVSTLYVRFDCFTAEKEGETGYKKMAKGSFAVLKSDNAAFQGYLEKLAAGNAAFVKASTVEIPVASGDMMPVALIACVAVATVALVVVSKKRKED